MQNEIERRTQVWFRHLPLDHPLVKVLFKAAVARQLAVETTRR